MAGGGAIKKSKGMAKGGAMKKSKGMAKGGAMKKSKYMARGGAMKMAKGMARGGAMKRVKGMAKGGAMGNIPKSVLSALGVVSVASPATRFASKAVRPKQVDRSVDKKLGQGLKKIKKNN